MSLYVIMCDYIIFNCYVVCYGQVNCFDMCGPSAITVPVVIGTPQACCSGGGGAFIDLTSSDETCKSCSTLISEHIFYREAFLTIVFVYYLQV